MEKKKYKPTTEMGKEAEEGLNLRKEFKRGGTAVGVARANQLVKQQELPIETVARIYSYCQRHRIDKQGKGWKKGSEGYPSAGLVAWKLWGGDAGDKWSTKIWEKYKKENKSLTSEFELLFNEDSSDELIKSIIYGLTK